MKYRRNLAPVLDEHDWIDQYARIDDRGATVAYEWTFATATGAIRTLHWAVTERIGRCAGHPMRGLPPDAKRVVAERILVLRGGLR